MCIRDRDRMSRAQILLRDVFSETPPAFYAPLAKFDEKEDILQIECADGTRFDVHRDLTCFSPVLLLLFMEKAGKGHGESNVVKLSYVE